jgi:superfamily II DNA/RNA helicase
MGLKISLFMFRVGRDGRYARGVAINFVTREDKPSLGVIKEFYNIEIKKMPRNVTGLI